MEKTIELSIKMLSGKGKTFKIEISPSDTVRDLKLKINKKEDFQYNNCLLIYKGDRLMGNRKLFTYNIVNGSSIYLCIRTERVFYKIKLLGNRTIGFNHFTEESIEQIKKQIEAEHDIPISEQLLMFGFNILHNYNTLSDYKITSGSVVELFKEFTNI